MYSSAAFSQIGFSGSLFWMCHQLIVTGLFELVFAAPSCCCSLSSLPPHAATTNAAAASSAAAARLGLLIARPSS